MKTSIFLFLFAPISTFNSISAAPTLKPTTKKPTRKPTTKKPTRKPTTKKPTRKPTTKKPTTAKPTTKIPTKSPTPVLTQAPTSNPTSPPTPTPTASPTTRAPTLAPTASPTTHPPTSSPSSPPTPTASPTTRAPTQGQTIPTTPDPSSPTTFDCPQASASASFGSSGLITLSIPSGMQSLCTLVQVSQDGQSFKPVGRTYAGHAWEASSGEFASLDWSCTTSSCVVTLPPLAEGALYQLTSFAAPQMVRQGTDEVARFLEQATFGATRPEIAAFDINANLADAFAGWVKSQQVSVPLTSHRTMFRQRMNAQMETATFNGAVTHPCQKGTLYRSYALSSKDAYKYLDIQTVGTKRIIKVDGFVRTVVEGPVYEFWNPSRSWPDGSYQLSNSVAISKINGNVWMYLPSAMGNVHASFDGQYGNPTIKFDSSIGAIPNVLITLSVTDATFMDSRYFAKSSVTNQEIVLTKDLSAPVCASLKQPGNPPNPVFVMYDNKYWIHDPRFETINNTIDSPSPDGGGKLSRDTFNVIQPDYTAFCANAPRTFLNEDHCVLSDLPTACAAETYNPYDNSNRPNFYVNVTETTIRGIYNATGGGVEGSITRYLYAVEGLRVEEDKSIGLPCERTNSRWVPITCTGAHLTLDVTVHEIFANLLSYDDDKNPNMRDIWNWWNVVCPAPVYGISGFEVQDLDGTKCWKNVHPDHLNVYDMTFWTRLDTHPGNSADRNPIKEFAQANQTTLMFPWWHSMNRWANSKWEFGRVGRLGDVVHYYSLPKELRSQTLNDYFGFSPESINYTASRGVIVCGSANEVQNDLALGGSQGRGAYDSQNTEFSTTDGVDYAKQKRIVWTEIALSAKDQLRQRVAWALSQILVISPAAFDADTLTEANTLYYDIFVRHAFGSYRSILKEVSFSPMMAQMLTYYGSRSTAFTWRQYNEIEYPDENYAREIMQLFTIGMYKLRSDGSVVRTANGDPVRVYKNDDIMEYARVWTGFEARTLRGNIENIWGMNRVDPLRINLEHRDVHPKMGLNRKYIGDGIPLCADLPDKHFLKMGATYRLLGRSPDPYLISEPKEWKSDPLAKRMKLSSDGTLSATLCGTTDLSSCTLKPKVVLSANLACSGIECDADTVRVVEVGTGIFYEYVPPPCVYHGFYENAKMIVGRRDWWGLTCADPRTLEASAACCPEATWWTGTWNDTYWGERTTFATAMTRCSNQLCNRWPRPECDKTKDPSVGSYCQSNDDFWTETSCSLRVKINPDGNVGIVHSPVGIEVEAIARHVQSDTQTFFRVDWSSSIAPDSITSNCTYIAACRLSIDGMCVCDASVTEEQVFFDATLPTTAQVLSSLQIGAFPPNIQSTTYTSTTVNGVTIYTTNGQLTPESIFEVVDDNGIRQLRKNKKSTVRISGSGASFRNPVHFISLSYPEQYQAQAETDAALDQYFYHSNVAPFLAIRFAQRFGISNPSPGFILRIGNAFRTGSYTFSSGGSAQTFGSGTYGDIGAMVACVLLDREARTTLLDADPAHGSLKEPLIKVVGFMRALEFTLSDDAGFVDFDFDMSTRIGQMAHAIPNVFSFFVPEHKPSGPVALAQLVAPEAQVITGPRTIDFLNGLYSLIKYGLTSCIEGFGRYQWWDNNDCWRYKLGRNNDGILGKLKYLPSPSSSPKIVIDELSTLLTAGRLSSSSRQLIETVVAAESNRTMALIKAQQLMVLTPEFHSTNVVRSTSSSRPEPESPTPSSRGYKAVVYVLLDGGMDSFNMLAPHTCSSTNSDGQTLLEQYYNERSSLSINDAERSRVISATGQPCSQFVIHEDLAIVQKLYNEGDLSFFANAGVLNRPVTKDNYYARTKTSLFGHNTMQDEAQKIDPFDGSPGTGILGRMCDILKRKGYSAQPITVEDASLATVGVPGAAIDPLLISPYSTTRFNPTTTGETFDPTPYLEKLNNETTLQSSLYGETWSRRLQRALFDNEVILRSIESTQLVNTFEQTDYSAKLKSVATLIASRDQRGTDRDVFFLKMGGWDHHSSLKSSLKYNFAQLNKALTSFTNEMKAQGQWNGVSLVITSDFSRTLTANSGEGSDHAWGGNYFVMGGAVKGGQIHGSYPDDITPSGPVNIGRGRLIPTMSWESVLNPIVQWMGADSQAELDYCLPNRVQAGTPLLQSTEVFDAP